MAVIVLAVIIAMAIILGAGELANKADPTTTTYTPRPEWYFFFLFELLRVIKPPDLVVLATVGIPTICLVLLAAAAVLRPQPGAPPGAPADRDHRRVRDDRGDGLPHLPGRARGGAGQDRHARVRRSSRPGRTSPTSPAAAPATSSARPGNPGPGPDLTQIGAKLPAQAIERTLRNPTAPMPSYADLPPEKFDALVEYLSGAEVEAGFCSRSRAPTATGREAQVRSMFDRIADRYDLMNSVMTAGMHHRWRERAADLARVGPGRQRARRVLRHRRPRARAGAAGSGRAGASSGSTSPPRCSSWRRPSRRTPARRSRGCRATRSSCPSTTASSMRPPSASARATSSTSSAASPRWRASCGPAGGS